MPGRTAPRLSLTASPHGPNGGHHPSGARAPDISRDFEPPAPQTSECPKFSRDLWDTTCGITARRSRPLTSRESSFCPAPHARQQWAGAESFAPPPRIGGYNVITRRRPSRKPRGGFAVTVALLELPTAACKSRQRRGGGS